MYGGKRFFFDHDYSERTLKQHRSYANIKRVLKKAGVHFQTPFNRMRIHWPDGMKTYEDENNATRDLRRRGNQVEGPAGHSGNTACMQGVMSAGLVAWRPGRNDRSGEEQGFSFKNFNAKACKYD